MTTTKKSSKPRTSAKKVVKKKALKKKGGSGASFNSLSNKNWPQKRNILIRPDRYKYVRKVDEPQGCVFCTCAQEEPKVETLTLVKTKWSMVVLNKFPYNNGHLLVIPRRHCGDLTELYEEEYEDLMALLRKAMKLIKHVYGPEGMNVGLNHGAVAGAGIPDHVHWHIVPRWFGDVNFFPLIAETKVVIETIEDSYRKLKVGWGEIV